jgi:hypothetical protein
MKINNDIKLNRLFLFLLFGLMFISCEKDDPKPINEEELITTVKVTCTPSTGGETVILSFVDLDGDGGNNPVITGGTFKSNTSYNVAIQFLNESSSPIEDITDEVRDEGQDHQVFMDSSGNFEFSYSYLDSDLDGNPIGLEMQFLIGAVGSGQLTLTLRHEPDKSGTGVSDGDLTNAGGETDVEVSFPVSVAE